MKNALNFVALTALLAAGCASHPTARPATLQAAFRHDFPIGVAINQRQSSGQDTNGIQLILTHYNAISPENIMKWALIHPQPGPQGYDFAPADDYVAFGERHHMQIVGHTLAWHSQTPKWVFQDANGRDLSGTNAADRELLLNRLHEHIQTVVGRYKGRIQIWDVVNEALNDSSNPDGPMLRPQSPWVRILGEEFIVKAFEWAHEADPAAILRYNDYSVENPAKRARLKALIRDLQAKHVPVMAVGSQTHANLSWPSAELEDEALTDIATLGLPIHITELDVNGSRGGQNTQSADVANMGAAGAGGAVESADEKLTRQYVSLFQVFMKHRKDIKLVTFWGVTDRDSWLRQGKPLLFDGTGQPKPAFAAVLQTAK